MKTAQLADITNEELQEASQLIVSGIKSSDPKLDTRPGTVLRSLLVTPEARIEATIGKQIDYARKASSLKMLADAEDTGEDVDPSDVNAILSNFSLTSPSGTYAEGIAKVTVTDGAQSYFVGEGSVFSTPDGLEFIVPASVSASVSGTGTSMLYRGSAGYFFLVPVKARESGAVYNIPQGTALSPSTSIYTFVSAEAYKSFSGGSDVADLSDTIKMIPSGLSIRGFVNKKACEGMLRDVFDSGNYPIISCSTAGYGSGVQRRDKHGVFGIGIGGRIDLYVRNFGDLFTKTDILTGTRRPVLDADGNVVQYDYEINLTPDKFPGSCWVKDVSAVYAIDSAVNSPLSFSCERVPYGTSSTWHDFDVSENATEIFNSMWQGLLVRALEVPADIGTSTSSSGDDEWSETRLFQVTAYCLPEAAKIQEYVDRDDVRSVSTDVVVRCPIICNVSVNASVVYDVDNPMDAEGAKYKIRKYINGLGFVPSLTRSEIVHILKGCGALSVDLSMTDMLHGTLHDAYGKEYNLSGDALNLDGLADDSAMLSSETTIFAVEPENIQLTLIPNR